VLLILVFADGPTLVPLEGISLAFHIGPYTVRPVTGLVEMIYMMLYEEESKGLDGPRRYLQDGPRAVT
jgi:hypothetical protein